MKTDETKPDANDGFRDRLATIDEKGKRVWVYAKKTSGSLTTGRNILGFALLAFFIAAPFIKIEGEQLLLFDFLNRKFVLFGVQFWPQDFHLFFLTMIFIMVFVIVFTVALGRLWCGWACPQTVFMELIFRRIENWIEGSPAKQRELADSPWNFNKIWRKGLKTLIFYGISFIISNYFLMYIIGSDAWISLVTDDPSLHIAGLAGMMIFSFIFYFIFAWFREQVCTIVCPYGRLQGVLLDKNSIVISYNYKRGENRSPFRKGENRSDSEKGDCIDCHQCVDVCPTGIDIRNGTQLECINCANCIDACDSVMKRVGFKPGLIKYASEKMIAEGNGLKLNARVIAYTLVLSVLLSTIIYFMASRHPVEATVLRAPGMLYQELEAGKISNLYNVKFVNKTNKVIAVELRLLSHKGEIKIVGNPIVLKNQAIGESVFFVSLDRKNIKEKEEIKIGVYSGDKQLDVTKATFVGPRNE
jgi:cytochrome c oxidase accessory protein FixG